MKSLISGSESSSFKLRCPVPLRTLQRVRGGADIDFDVCATPTSPAVWRIERLH
jgi:hypothetical protein